MKRRDFIEKSALGMAVAYLAPSVLVAGDKKKSNFGIQLYTLRDVLPSDPKGVLKKIADAGYSFVESYKHHQLGLFWGMSNKDFAKYLKDIGLKMVSAHYSAGDDIEKISYEAGEIGVKYLFYPYEGSRHKPNEVNYQSMPKTKDEFKVFADKLNKWGEICKKNGLKYGFHNHDHTFEPIEDWIPQDILMQNTNKELVDFELDMYWVVTAGQNPIDWFKKYPGRFKAVHVKDREKNATERERTCTLGTGSIDYKSILPIAKKSGVEYFIVEQERYEGTSPLQCIIDNAKYMQAIKW